MGTLPWPPPSRRWQPRLAAPSPLRHPGSYNLVFFHAPLDEVLQAVQSPTLQSSKGASDSETRSQQPQIKQRAEEIEPFETKSNNPDPAAQPVTSQKRPRRPRAVKRDEWDRLFHQGRYARATSSSSDDLNAEEVISEVQFFKFNEHIDTPNVKQALFRIDIHQVPCAMGDKYWPPFWLACWFFEARTLRSIPTPKMDSVWTYNIPPPMVFSNEIHRRDKEGQILEQYKIPPVHRIQKTPESSSSDGAVVERRQPNRVVDRGKRRSWDHPLSWKSIPPGTVHPCMMHIVPSKDCIALRHSHPWFQDMTEDDEQGGDEAETKGQTQE